MELKTISPRNFTTDIINLWEKRWLLLTSGDFKSGNFNTMTVAWGSIGQMWNKPFVQAVVRPTRYTFEFMEKYDTFTLCAFPDEYKPALNLLGSKSGRDGDKIAETNLNVMQSSVVAAPSFKEADLIIECKKIYWDDFKPENFLVPEIDNNYKLKDYHRVYFGEILAIRQA